MFIIMMLIYMLLVSNIYAGINDGRCGPNYAYYGCPRDFCCSSFEFCGNTPNHCNQRLAPFTRSDGRCGPHYDNAPCPIGNCCSKLGECGTGTQFCNADSIYPMNNGTAGPSSSLQRVQSSLSSAYKPLLSSSSQPTTPYIRSDSRCGAEFGGAICRTGQCCSAFNYCGSGPDYCPTSSSSASATPKPTPSASSSPVSSSASLPSTGSDLRCGASFGNAVCPPGQCCSQYNYCGSGPDYCPVSSTPAPTSSQPPSSLIRPDNRCGASFGNAVCPQGQCCSQYNYCGSGPDYCPVSSTPIPKSSQPPSSLIRPDNRCGASFGNAVCPQGQCCSQYNYCGSGPDYCSTSSLTTLLPKSFFDSLISKDPTCEGPPKYTYDNFIRAANAYPTFANQGSVDAQKRDLAAFFAHVLHESGDLCYINELAPSTPATYCSPSGQYPCYPGANYHGRGPFQLSWNFNYIKFGQTLSPDQALAIYQVPDTLGNDGELLFRTAFWYYMLPQPTGSMHDNMVATQPNFAQTIRIINGPIECNGGNPAQVNDRVVRYQALCKTFGVDPGTLLYC